VFVDLRRVALLISVVGVGGVLAFLGKRTYARVRNCMALGAQRRDILTNVIAEGAVMAGLGGCGRGGPCVRYFGLGARCGQIHWRSASTRVVVFLASSVVILGAAVIASAVPANRAAAGQRGGGAAGGVSTHVGYERGRSADALRLTAFGRVNRR